MNFEEAERVLGAEEARRLADMGRDLAAKHGLDVGRMPPEKLREFVREYLMNRIRTDKDFPRDMLHLVFLPVAFGLNPPAKLIRQFHDLIGIHPPEDDGPEPPLKVPELVFPDPPVEPQLHLKKPDEDMVAKIVSEIEWQDMPPDSLDKYLESIEALNAQISERYASGLAAWEDECRNWKKTCRDLRDAHEQQLREAAEKAALFERDHAAWSLKAARSTAVFRGLQENYVSKVGCLWEFLDMAMPLAVNGCPMFTSVHVMHVDDWRRCRETIVAETQRMSEIQVDCG